MKSKRSARPSRRSQDSQHKTPVPSEPGAEIQPLGSKLQGEERTDDWKGYFSPEQSKVLEEATELLRAGLPWLEAPEKVHRVVFRASFPRSVCGKYQDDNLARVLAFANRDTPLTEPQLVEITRRAFSVLSPPDISRREESLAKEIPLAPIVAALHRLGREGVADAPRTYSEFFANVATRLEHLETYRPLASDFAIQALQEAFVGLMERKYDWGKKRFPTKGEVTEMTKAQLERAGNSIKSGWTKMLKEAGLEWLQPGAAGQPKKREVDDNLKAKKVFLDKLTKYVNEQLQGNWVAMLWEAKPVFGGKPLYRQEEQNRLKEANEFSYSESKAP
jgi:hypothetical protein